MSEGGAGGGEGEAVPGVRGAGVPPPVLRLPTPWPGGAVESLRGLSPHQPGPADGCPG